MAWLLQGPLDGTDPNRTTPIRSQMTVGRDDRSDLAVGRAAVSGNHARLELDGGHLVVVDVGSRNGTYVNGNQVETATLQAGDLLQFADVVYRVVHRDDTPRSGTVVVAGLDVAKPLIGFRELLEQGNVVPFFQPIVPADGGSTTTYELLGRSRVPGLENPAVLFKAAAQLQLETELSELFRTAGAREAERLPDPHIFMNSHPAENVDWRQLTESMVELSKKHPDLQLTLEIHEATVTNREVMTELRAILKDAGIGLAYDDFGAGQARLRELLDVPPDVLKFDIGLVRGLDSGPPARLRMVSTLVQMVRELGIRVLAEGVETAGEAEACIEAGFELLQGYHFGRPAPVEHWLGEEPPS